MYNKFNLFIADFTQENSSEEDWYNYAIQDAIETVKQFNIEHWQLLLLQLKYKSVLWQKRLIECLKSFYNPYQLTIILEVLDTKDEALFAVCTDCLKALGIKTKSY